MKPGVVALCAAGVTAGVLVLALYGNGRQVELPVYEKPVEFFTEGTQGLTLASLPSGIESMSAEACAGCHKAEHAEWKASAHARSVTEPVFAAAFKAEPRFLCRSCHSPLLEQHPVLVHQLRKDPKVLIHGELLDDPRRSPLQPGRRALGEQLASSAMVSVRPRFDHFGMEGKPFVTEPNKSFQKSLASEGVTCVTCHVRDGTILTANATGPANAPHPLSYSPIMKKADFCGGCHQFNIENPRSHPFETKPFRVASHAPAVVREFALLKQRAQQAALTAEHGGNVVLATQETVPDTPDSPGEDEPPVPPQPGLDDQYQQEPRVQHTLDEFRISPAAARGETCQSCHMPAQKGRSLHTWAGRDSLDMLKQAVSMSVRLDKKQYRKGDKLQAVIRLKNDAGHKFPTGDSIHAGILDVWLRDGKKTLGRQVFVMSNQNAVSPFVALSSHTLVLEGSVAGMPSPPGDAPRLEAPQRADTRLLPGEEAMIVYSQKVTPVMEKAKELSLRVRVFHSAVHPGFKHSSIDPKLNTLRLIREEVLPVRATAASNSKPAGVRGS